MMNIQVLHSVLHTHACVSEKNIYNYIYIFVYILLLLLLKSFIKGK